MRATRFRLLAWAIALSLLACCTLRSWWTDRAASPPRPAVANESSAPGLLAINGPVGPLLSPRPSITVQRDFDLRAVNVIREPGFVAPREGEKPEFTPSYELPPDHSSRLPPPQVPVELLLNEPQRTQAEIAPRTAQDLPSDDEYLPASPLPATPRAPALESSPPSPLPIVSRDNPAMQPVNDMARQYVQRGFSLGERSAVFAARTEFIQALRTIAQAVDAQAGLAPKDPQSCSQALVRGLLALSEADDFAPTGSRLDGNLDLPAIIAAHRTPAAKSHHTSLSQLAALQLYFDYARNELTRAAAASPTAAQALTGLGKTYTVSTEKNPHRLAGAKAMVFHQAAATTDGNNHLAANELGVLLARYGQWEQAKQSLLQSLRVQSDASAWRNLATVHAQLGEHDLAALARQELELMQLLQPARPSDIAGSPVVQWVDPKAFAGPPEEGQPTARMAAQPALRTAAKPAAAKSDSWSWLPWR